MGLKNAFLVLTINESPLRYSLTGGVHPEGAGGLPPNPLFLIVGNSALIRYAINARLIRNQINC